jgi:hypothetical protein
VQFGLASSCERGLAGAFPEGFSRGFESGLASDRAFGLASGHQRGLAGARPERICAKPKGSRVCQTTIFSGRVCATARREEKTHRHKPGEPDLFGFGELVSTPAWAFETGLLRDRLFGPSLRTVSRPPSRRAVETGRLFGGCQRAPCRGPSTRAVSRLNRREIV